jgi:hypothetical protein
MAKEILSLPRMALCFSRPIPLLKNNPIIQGTRPRSLSRCVVLDSTLRVRRRIGLGDERPKHRSETKVLAARYDEREISVVSRMLSLETWFAYSTKTR